MKIAVFGAGAIGGVLAARLAAAGQVPLLVARGVTYEAIAANGLLFCYGKERFHVYPALARPGEKAGVCDVVILALKSHAVMAALDDLAPYIGPDTLVVTAQNGMPWWYFHGFPSPHQGRRLTSLDPEGRIAAAIRAERVLGCVVWQAAHCPEPGIVHLGFDGPIVLGSPAGQMPERGRAFISQLAAAGIEARETADIRSEIWFKLWGNLSFNPLSALTGATLGELADDPGARHVLGRMMEEAERIANAYGVTFPMDVNSRIGEARRVGAHKSSMLQDLEGKRTPELAALLGAVLEMAEMAGVKAPTLQMIHDLTALRFRMAQGQGE